MKFIYSVSTNSDNNNNNETNKQKKKKRKKNEIGIYIRREIQNSQSEESENVIIIILMMIINSFFFFIALYTLENGKYKFDINQVKLSFACVEIIEYSYYQNDNNFIRIWMIECEMMIIMRKKWINVNDDEEENSS